MSNSFELCPTHFSRGVEKKIYEVFAPSGYGPANRCSSIVTILPFFKHDFQMFIVKSYQGRN